MRQAGYCWLCAALTCLRGAFCADLALPGNNSADFLVVNLPAFPLLLNMNTRATGPYPGFSYFPDAQGYCPNIVLPLPVEPFLLCISNPLPRRTLYDMLPAENAPQVLLSRLHNFCFSISSFPCQDSGQPPVFSAADFHPPVTAGAAAQLRTDRQISSSSCKKWPQKCPSF